MDIAPERGPETLVDPVDRIIASLTAFCEGNADLAVLVGSPQSGKTAAVRAMIEAFGGRAATVANPLKSPLTVHRILLQLGAGDGQDEDIAALIAQDTAQGMPGLLVIDDAHTLAPGALPALARIVGAPLPDGSRVKLVLAGGLGLPELLASSEIALFRDPSRYRLFVLTQTAAADGLVVPASAFVPEPITAEAAAGVAAPVIAPSVPADALIPTPAPLHPGISPSWKRRLLGAAAAAALMAGIAAFWPYKAPEVVQAAEVGSKEADVVGPSGPLPPLPDSSADALPDAAEAGPALPPPAIVPPPMVAPAVAAEGPATEPPATRPASSIPETQIHPTSRRETGPSEAKLRRDFTAFLQRAGHDTATLTPAAREALFHEYLGWLSRAGSGPASPR